MKPLSTEDTWELIEYDPYRWCQKRIDRLEEVCLLIDEPDLFDQIYQKLNQIWQEEKTLRDSEFYTLITKLSTSLDSNNEVKYCGIPFKLRAELSAALEKAIKKEGLCYSDNYRFGKQSHSESLKAYKHLQSTGCCGYFDEEIILDGEVYLYGCNYGH